ncbi:hypothetical protein Y1Q_0016173 [Alligator mississippiensis]|uniref:Uncharacterized protein n=1 Tax=Alligator mississippiensis TaxID=8496 RepID=A0A151P186_ALLMI|nr:hypothetical protein Y1Q_0016173 [Alligator mississippiensis]
MSVFNSLRCSAAQSSILPDTLDLPVPRMTDVHLQILTDSFVSLSCCLQNVSPCIAANQNLTAGEKGKVTETRY